MKKAATQEGIGQFFLVVGGDDDDRAVLGLDQLLGFVAVKLHAINFTQQVIRELNVGLVDFIDQQHNWLVGLERLPQHAFHNVVCDVFDTRFTQLRIAQAAHRVVLVKALLGLGGRFDVPLH